MSEVHRIKPGTMAAILFPDKTHFTVEFEAKELPKMGNRLVKGSKKFGQPRDYKTEGEAREKYQRQSAARPKQRWNEELKRWELAS